MNVRFLLFIISLYTNLAIANSNIRIESSSKNLINTKSVFGEFERKQINDSSDLSTRIVGQIEARFGLDDTLCTGTLIGPKYIITAAHCVYDKESGTWASNVVFIPGRTNLNTRPYGEIKATKFYVNKNFTDKSITWGHDYAVIELESNIGDQIGYAEIEMPSIMNQKFNVQIMGYPGDKEYGTLWNVNCAAKKIDGEELIYRCDTFGGMSGSAIRLKEDLNKIIGIHTYGSEEENGGWIISPQIYNNIISWLSGSEDLANTVTHGNYFLPKIKYSKVHFKNNCETNVKMYAHYLNLKGEWVTDGSWTLKAKGDNYLFNTSDDHFYFYGTTADTIWSGEYNFELEKVILPMKEFKLKSDDGGIVTVELNCSN